MNKTKIIKDFSPRKYQILNDFEILLEFIIDNKPIVSRKVNSLSSHIVLELNQKFSKTLNLDLKQHNQSSYPYINSLMLVLRASGLGVVSYLNNKLVLTVDTHLYKQWLSFNDTEKYFNLFMAWITNGFPAIIGVKTELAFSLDRILAFMLVTHPHQLNQEDNKELKSPKYSVGIHNLVLLDMFGFVKITDNSNIVSKKWELEQIQLTDIGIFVFETIYKITNEFGFDLFYHDSFPVEFKASLQKKFKKLFTNYISDIKIIDQKKANKECIFKVSLGRVWRKIAIPIDYPLHFFCRYIINCFNFDHSHMYRIEIKNRFGYNETYNHPEMEDDYFGYPSAREFTMNDLNIRSGTTMNFVYDFGDNWQFDIICEKIETQKSKEPRIIAQKGNPPEQYG